MSDKDFAPGLFSSEENYVQILNSLNDMVLVKGANSKLLWANQAFCKYYNMNNDQLRGIIDSKVVEPDYTAQYVKDDAYVYETGNVLSIPQEPVVRYDGEVRYFNTVKSPIRDASGSVIMTVGISRDITHTLQMKHINELNEKLSNAVDFAKKASEAKALFMSNISHELRTPMHAILSFAKFGQEQIDLESKEVLKSYFDEIHESGERLMGFLSKLLDLSTLESHKTDYTYEQNFFAHVIHPLVGELAVEAKARNLKMVVNSRAPHLEAAFDLDRLTQVLRNLLRNAIQFSHEGSVITIDVDEIEDRVICSVRNIGVGIPDEEQELIFEKFTQSSRTRSRSGGTGLGLAICKEIITDHRGEIWAKSMDTGETHFTFAIPKSRSV